MTAFADFEEMRKRFVQSGRELRDTPRNVPASSGKLVFRRDAITFEECSARLPEEVRSPSGRTVVTISQSRLKRLWQAQRKAAGCWKRFEGTEILGMEGESSAAQAMGSRFEYQLTGALTRAGSVPPRLTTGTGRDSADQKRIDEAVAMARHKILPELGVNVDEYQAGGGLRHKCLAGTPDLIKVTQGHVLIEDIKYSGLIENKMAKASKFGWVAEELANKWETVVQACHYTLLAKLIWPGKQVRFRFIVFDQGEPGRFRCYRMEIGHGRMVEHMNFVLDQVDVLKARMAGEGFPANPSYEECQGCPVKCDHYVRYPDVHLVRVD